MRPLAVGAETSSRSGLQEALERGHSDRDDRGGGSTYFAWILFWGLMFALVEGGARRARSRPDGLQRLPFKR